MGNFDEILEEADGIILSRGNLGIDLPPEKVFLFQEAAVHRCNMAGKPAVVTRVVDSMTDYLRPTRAEATDVANAVLDGSDAILLGAETLRGLYPVETISTVGKICAVVNFTSLLFYVCLMPTIVNSLSMDPLIVFFESSFPRSVICSLYYNIVIIDLQSTISIDSMSHFW
ncbi:pyruvate kinase 2, cytosolic-like [Solanum pennellii]|uniref:Pyruvate kinase n=1 Tax=Solanum pennellii TaxID=28526 RepID=A0ABM1UZV8_SOLPN|nr:pyruvate kinase 2, cytosolic-like [Solanum pennellii]